MLYLRTGLPGAGKTLNAIREIDLEHQPDPDDPTKRLHKDPDNPDLPPRTIYYGIPDMKLIDSSPSGSSSRRPKNGSTRLTAQ
ncbi:hypothetical protein PCP53_32350 (plasmid) [Pseudomonas aeruginosa]|uniref:hypothetical protein n=1 Tax=Pseudomonas aeruginosa TaxID=287 RepID=UPI002E2A6FAC|nr:hypothetical protein [Pseudomonas aeruginosa]